VQPSRIRIALRLSSTFLYSLRSVGTRSESSQYLRPASYLFLRKPGILGAHTEDTFRPPWRTDNRVVRHSRLHYECAFIRYKSVSKSSSQRAQETFLGGFPPARSLYPDKVLEVLVVVLVGYMYLFPPANERTKDAGNERMNERTNIRTNGRTDGRTENLQLTRASL